MVTVVVRTAAQPPSSRDRSKQRSSRQSRGSWSDYDKGLLRMLVVFVLCGMIGDTVV
mgnify:CR=1 FL=1